jgi:hypothetical protein
MCFYLKSESRFIKLIRKKIHRSGWNRTCVAWQLEVQILGWGLRGGSGVVKHYAGADDVFGHGCTARMSSTHAHTKGNIRE